MSYSSMIYIHDIRHLCHQNKTHPAIEKMLHALFDSEVFYSSESPSFTKCPAVATRPKRYIESRLDVSNSQLTIATTGICSAEVILAGFN